MYDNTLVILFAPLPEKDHRKLSRVQGAMNRTNSGLSGKQFVGYNPVVKRLYWINPDVYEVEVEVKSVGESKLTIEPIVFHPDEGGRPADKGRLDRKVTADQVIGILQEQ